MDYTPFSDSELESLERGFNLDIESHQNAIDKYEKDLAEIKAEQDRRALEKYFDSHPKLPRIKIGDKVAIIQELIDQKEQISKQGYKYPLGSIWFISRIDLTGTHNGIDNGHGSGTGYITFELLLWMRSAYLVQHESEDADG